jgi:nicotinamidase-related amidase
MDALIVVDMQVGLLNGGPKHDLRGVVERINRLAAKVHEQSGVVIFMQHCSGAEDDFVPDTPGWALLPELDRAATDIIIRKSLNDPFVGTDLAARLKEMAPARVFVTGWATDLCVDATLRSAVSHHHDVVVVTDGHTLNDRPHLDAVSIIRHHHWVWSHLITPRSVRLARADELLL